MTRTGDPAHNDNAGWDRQAARITPPSIHMTLIYLDSETCGLHSMPVLLQYAEEDGPIELYNVWKEPVWKTLALLERLAQGTVVGFNLAFDWFMVAKLLTIWRLLPPDWIPEEHIDEIAMLEPKGSFGPCIKPVSACDLMLHSRKNEYQGLMEREDVRIRKVPTALAYALAEELEKRIQLDAIFFARTADKDAPRWQVFNRRTKDGNVDEHFRDVVLKFHPAGGLKYLAEYAMGYEPKFHFDDVELPTCFRPKEFGYAPTALHVSSPDKNWEVYNDSGEVSGYAWPGVIRKHIEHWATNEPAREYAKDDIVYTRALYGHFGRPEPGDDDSVLACMVAAVRWRGFEINVPGIEALLKKAQAIVDASPVNVNKPAEVRAYIGECMNDIEMLIIEETTKKAKIKEVANMKVRAAELLEEDDDESIGTEDWKVSDRELCDKCNGKLGQCARCNGRGFLEPGPHPASKRANEILAVKSAAKEVELYAKLLHAKRFYANFKVIGALSARMSGDSGLNAQGIKHSAEVRSMFPLCWDGYVLSGGDFDAFEVCIGEAVCKDPKLTSLLKAGKKIHAIFAQAMYPGKSYEDILATKDTENDLYSAGKQGFFGAIFYGGNELTLKNKLAIPIEDGKAAIASFLDDLQGVKKWRLSGEARFCSMRQVEGRQVVWQEPEDYVESFLGHRRYFTLENRVCKELFELAHKPPKHWKDCKVKVVRRDRIQAAFGAVMSALFGAGFAIQAANMRAALNHEIQSPGATITKRVQRKVWDIQPAGVHKFLVAPMNVHDEILSVTAPEAVEQVAAVVNESVESFRPQVPLIGISWVKRMTTWANKKG